MSQIHTAANRAAFQAARRRRRRWRGDLSTSLISGKAPQVEERFELPELIGAHMAWIMQIDRSPKKTASGSKFKSMTALKSGGKSLKGSLSMGVLFGSHSFGSWLERTVNRRRMGR